MGAGKAEVVACVHCGAPVSITLSSCTTCGHPQASWDSRQNGHDQPSAGQEGEGKAGGQAPERQAEEFLSGHRHPNAEESEPQDSQKSHSGPGGATDLRGNRVCEGRSVDEFSTADLMLTEEEENAIIDRVAELVPDVPREEIAGRIRQHSRSPHVRCRKFLSALIHGELQELRCGHG